MFQCPLLFSVSFQVQYCVVVLDLLTCCYFIDLSRFGEHKGSYCTLASFPGQDSEVKVVVENCPPEVKLETSAAAAKESVKSPMPTKVTLKASSPSNAAPLPSSLSHQTTANSSSTVQSSAKDTKIKVVCRVGIVFELLICSEEPVFAQSPYLFLLY